MTCATIVQSYLLIITMPMGGITLGTQPVVSFNYERVDLPHQGRHPLHCAAVRDLLRAS